MELAILLLKAYFEYTSARFILSDSAQKYKKIDFNC